MNNITLVNVNSTLELELQNHYIITEDISDNVFIDWYLPKDNIEQITILEDSIKNKSNVVLFDRYLSLKQHEVDWLLRYKNVHLMEPSLLARRGFKYMPFWYKTHFPFHPSVEDETYKTIDIGIVKEPHKSYKIPDYDLPIADKYDVVKMALLICSERDYKIGYLPDMNEMLHYRCVPLLPGEHKYYWKLFQGLVVKDIKDIEWCSNILRLYDVLIFGIYDNMEKYFPEMKVENVAKQIVKILDER